MKKKMVAIVGSLVTSLLVVGSVAASGGIKLVIDGKEVVPAVTPQIVKGHVMVPIGFVSDALGANVHWNGPTQTVSIDSQGKKSSQLEINQFIVGLAPSTPDQAMELYMNGLQHRNAALQYAAFSEELKKKALPDFVQMNWVTGTSSPWLDNWKVINQVKVDEQTRKYQIQTQMASSTGPEQPTSMTLTIVKNQEYWFVSSLGNK